MRNDGIAFRDSKRIGDQARHKAFLHDKNLLARGGVIQKRGDWSWMKGVLGIVGWDGEGTTKRVCFRCLADKGNYPFTDASLNAAWRFTDTITFLNGLALRVVGILEGKL